MSTPAKFHALRLFEFVAEHLFATRTDKGVLGSGVENQDKVGEVVDQAAGELLLLVEAALHFAALGDVHKRALIPQHAAGIIANGCGRIEAYDGSAVLTDQRYLLPLNHGLPVDFVFD